MNDFKLALQLNIQKTIRRLRAVGTISMGVRNLLQVTPTPSPDLPGAPKTPEAYAELFASMVKHNSFVYSVKPTA